MLHRLPALLLVLTTTACNFFSATPAGTGSDTATRDAGSDARLTPSDVADANGASDDGEDATIADVSDASADDMRDADAADTSCSPETDASLCATANANCGTVELVDNCGETRTVDCGTCVDPAECGAVEPDRCGCLAESDADFCTRLGKNCGTVVELDDCDQLRTVDCGECTAPDVCGDGGENICGCTSESDTEFCARLGKNCGAVTAADNCEVDRTVDCGTCAPGTDCGTIEPNICECDCVIDGACLLDGGANPDNQCEVCDPATSTTDWTVTAGAICDDGDGCTTDDVCGADGLCAGDPVICNAGECEASSCDPNTGTCVTATLADGTPCTDDGLACTDDVCEAGACTHPIVSGCLIDGTCYANNDSNSSCESCKPNTSNDSWTVSPNTCGIDGACYAAGDANPDNPCEVCDPDADPRGWTALPDGNFCAAMQACECMGGTCRTAGTMAPCSE